MAPAYAVPRLLARNGLSLQDFDFYEIHEAFASQVLCTLKAWEDPVFCKERLGLEQPLGSIDRDKLNTHGGSLAAGHPFAATGGRIVSGLAKMLNKNGSGQGLISICAAGGLGVIAICAAEWTSASTAIMEATHDEHDRYQQLVNTPIGKIVSKQVGLPVPVRLERYEPGQPVINGPVLLGAAPGATLAAPIARVLKAIDAAVETPSGDEVRQAAADAGLDAGLFNPDTASDEETFKALVFDATGIADASQLRRGVGVLPPDDQARQAARGG